MLWKKWFRGCYLEDVNNLLVLVIGFSDYKLFKEETNPLSNIQKYGIGSTYPRIHFLALLRLPQFQWNFQKFPGYLPKN